MYYTECLLYKDKYFKIQWLKKKPRLVGRGYGITIVLKFVFSDYEFIITFNQLVNTALIMIH